VYKKESHISSYSPKSVGIITLRQTVSRTQRTQEYQEWNFKCETWTEDLSADGRITKMGLKEIGYKSYVSK